MSVSNQLCAVNKFFENKVAYTTVCAYLSVEEREKIEKLYAKVPLALLFLPTPFKATVIKEERQMLAYSEMLIALVAKAALNWREKRFKAFDPNPGDCGCQMRGYLLSRFAQEESLSQEAMQLEAQMQGPQKAVALRRKNTTIKGTVVFFKAQFGEMCVSKEMAFILKCCLAATVRIPYETRPNGIVMTKTDVSQLGKLCNKIIAFKELCKKMVEGVQKELSITSNEMLFEEATAVTSLGKKEREELVTMLSPPLRCLYTASTEFEPKLFGSLFYQYKALLFRLREECGVVLFRPIGKPFQSVVLQSRQKGEEFAVLSNSEVALLSKKAAVVVFEGIISANVNRDQFVTLLNQEGFTNLIFVLAAIEPFYGVTKIPPPAGVNFTEITRYKEKAVQLQCQLALPEAERTLVLDHVFCNSLEEEGL